MGKNKNPSTIGRMISVIGRARGLKLMSKDKVTRIPHKCGLFLAVLLKEDGYSQDELARRVFVDKATVARALRLLETQGFIIRKEAENNRRMKLVHLTDKARSAAVTMQKVVDDVDSALTRGFDQSELELLERLLARIEANARRLHKSRG